MRARLVSTRARLPTKAWANAGRATGRTAPTSRAATPADADAPARVRRRRRPQSLRLRLGRLHAFELDLVALLLLLAQFLAADRLDFLGAGFLVQRQRRRQ